MSQRLITISDDLVLRICDAFNFKLLGELWPNRVSVMSQKVEWDGGHNYTETFRHPLDNTESGGFQHALVSLLRRVDYSLRFGERLLDTSGEQPYATMGGAHEFDGFNPANAQVVFLGRRDLQILQERRGPAEFDGRKELHIECSLQANAPWIGNDAVGNSRAMALAFQDMRLQRV